MPQVNAVLPSLEDVLSAVRRAASERDHEGENLRLEIEWLGEIGLLQDAFRNKPGGGWATDPRALTALLRNIGRASLPLGRLFEGHVNAAQLLDLYANHGLLDRLQSVVRHGGLLGVWGADGPDPVKASATSNGFSFRGSKVFCSGLGVVHTALISAEFEGHIRLFALDVRELRRADHGQWRVAGMRATTSGGFSFDGMSAPFDTVVGAPDAYFAEPYFLGGMYRMCAVQLGGLDALLEEAAAAIVRRNKALNNFAQWRIGRLESLRYLAEASVKRLAETMTSIPKPETAAQEAVLVREGLEGLIVDALKLSERLLGTEMHREDTELSRVRRDLSFYIRQAAIDERLQDVGRRLLLD